MRASTRFAHASETRRMLRRAGPSARSRARLRNTWKPRPGGSPHGLRAAKTDESRDHALVGRPFLAASRLSCRLSGRTFNGAVVLFQPRPSGSGCTQRRHQPAIAHRPPGRGEASWVADLQCRGQSRDLAHAGDRLQPFHPGRQLLVGAQLFEHQPLRGLEQLHTPAAAAQNRPHGFRQMLQSLHELLEEASANHRRIPEGWRQWIRWRFGRLRGERNEMARMLEASGPSQVLSPGSTAGRRGPPDSLAPARPQPRNDVRS